MDDAVLVEAIPESSSSSRCLQASASLASDHFGLWLGPEFHADVEFWPLTVAWGMWSSVGTLEAPLYSLYPQRPSYTLWSDASGDALRGYCLESGLWWRLDLDANVRAHWRSCKKHRDNLFINLLELLGLGLRRGSLSFRPSHVRRTRNRVLWCAVITRQRFTG